MANLNIDINAVDYQRHRTRFGNLVAFIRGRLKIYHGLDAEQQERWKASDPLMNDIIRFVDKVQNGKDV